MIKKRTMGVLAILALAGLVAAPAAAQSAETSNKWTFELMPLFWGSGINIDSQTSAGEQTIDLKFSDIMKDVHFGALGTFEMRKDRLGFLFDGMYVDIRKSIPQTPQTPGDLSLKSQQSGVSLAVVFRVTRGRTILDLLGGARYNYMYSLIDVTSGPYMGLSSETKDSWVDGFGGARLLVPLAKSWTLLAYGDLGGGGSKIAYQTKGAVNWRLSRVFALELGYRHQYFHRVTDGDIFKMAKSGVYLGLGIKF